MRNSHHQTTRIILPRSDDESETKSGASDRRSFKDLTIHETIECPVDPDTLPPDAVRVADESVIVQDIEITPHDLRFQFGAETVDLLRAKFDIPHIWQHAIADVGEAQFDRTSLATLLDDWFGEGNKQARIAIEHAAAIVYYRHQASVPLVRTIASLFDLTQLDWPDIDIRPFDY
jgi:hypothetical protein